MANIDMCDHGWPGSGCKDCKREAKLEPLAKQLYDAKPRYIQVLAKVEWNSLSHAEKKEFYKLAEVAWNFPADSDDVILEALREEGFD